MKNLFDLSGKVAVITGGAGLLGKAFASGFASHGADVWIADIDPRRSKAVQRNLRLEGLQANCIFLDIADRSSITQCIAKILTTSKRIDIWVNNAYPQTRDWKRPFEKVSTSSWRKTIDQHLNGYCFCCQEIAKAMKKQKGGVIINIASIYGVVGPDFSIYEGTPMTMPAAYSAIKGGIINFTRYLACYYGPYGIRVNSISPGGVLNGQSESFVKRYSQKTPLRRMAKPEDIVGALIYLASDVSSYVTGHNLIVDGGWTIS